MVLHGGTLSQPVDVESPASRTFHPSQQFYFLLRLVLVFMVLFALLRAGLILRNWSSGVATGGEIAMSFFIGMRFDLAIACYLAIPMTIATYIPWTSPGRGPRTQRVYLWFWTVIISVLSFVLLAEFEFFREFQSRYNQLALEYLDHPQIVGGMVWYNYPVVRYVLIWLVIATLVRFAIGWAVSRSFPLEAPPARRPAWVDIATIAVIVVGLIFGARGGFQGEPLKWGHAFKGNSEFANQMSLNGLYSLSEAVRDTMVRGRAAEVWRKGDLAESRKIARGMVVASGEHLIDPDNRTMLRNGDPGSSIVLKRADGKPINVVVVMMESYSGRYVGALGSKANITPHFDELVKDGIFFDRTLSCGSHTHQGIFGTQLGFPNLPSYERLMDIAISNQHFLSFGEIFSAKGYDTFFLYNGDLDWDNMRGFFRKQGIKNFISGEDMVGEAKYRDAVWGVSDGDLFDRANREFEAASKKGPFFSAIMTLSNHAPFQVPPVPGVGPITGFGEDNKRLEAMRYADYAVGQFIENAKKLSYFKDTLFVFVGDHGFHVPPVMTEVHLLFHHVPLLFYAPGLMERKGVDHRVATHMNVIPSVLGMLGMNDSPRSPWGRSLFNDSFNDEGFAVFKMSTGGTAVGLARGDKVLVLGTATGKPTLSRYSLAFPPSLEKISDPELEKSMERELRAYVKCALDDLTNRRAGPAAEDPD